MAWITEDREKLIRDEPGRRILAEGGDVRRADVSELGMLLAVKLVEEANEVVEAVANCTDRRVGILRELADLAEVVDTLCYLFAIEPSDVRQAQTVKRLAQGSFDERFVWRKEP